MIGPRLSPELGVQTSSAATDNRTRHAPVVLEMTLSARSSTKGKRRRTSASHSSDHHWHGSDLAGSSPSPASRQLLLLEPLARELQRPAVLGDRPHDVIRRAGGDLGLDLERHRHLRADQAGQMRDHLVGDAAGVAADTGGVEGDRAVETLGLATLPWAG